MAPPIPTIPLLSDELVAIKMPWVELATSVAFSRSGSMVAGNRSSHGVYHVGLDDLHPVCRCMSVCASYLLQRGGKSLEHSGA